MKLDLSLLEYNNNIRHDIGSNRSSRSHVFPSDVRLKIEDDSDLKNGQEDKFNFENSFNPAKFKTELHS